MKKLIYILAVLTCLGCSSHRSVSKTSASITEVQSAESLTEAKKSVLDSMCASSATSQSVSKDEETDSSVTEVWETFKYEGVDSLGNAYTYTHERGTRNVRNRRNTHVDTQANDTSTYCGLTTEYADSLVKSSNYKAVKAEEFSVQKEKNSFWNYLVLGLLLVLFVCAVVYLILRRQKKC